MSKLSLEKSGEEKEEESPSLEQEPEVSPIWTVFFFAMSKLFVSETDIKKKRKGGNSEILTQSRLVFREDPSFPQRLFT